MWWRALAGIVVASVGVVWIAQGSGALHGSFMTGETTWTEIGSAFVAAGIGLVAWAVRIYIGHGKPGGPDRTPPADP